MINIDKKHYIAEGETRICYQHPEDKNLCIKVIKQNQEHTWLQQEIIYYNQIQEKHKEYSLNFYAKYYGTVETNLGTGYLYDLIRDDNGSISLTLEHYFRDGNIFSNEELRNAYLKLKSNMTKYNIFCTEMSSRNILINVEKNTINFVIVDGLWSGENIKEIKIASEQYKFFIKWSFLYFYSDIALKYVDFDFINGNSKIMTSLKTIDNLYFIMIKEENILDCNNKEIFYCFKKNIRNNIDVITYDFEKVHPLLLVYYLRYKLKKLTACLKYKT